MTITNGQIYSRGSGIQNVYARNSRGSKVVASGIPTKQMGDIYTADEGGRYFVRIFATTSGNTTLATGVAGYQIEVQSYTIVASGATGVSFLSNTTTLTGPHAIAANGSIASNAPSMRANDGENLIINLTAATTVTGNLTYRLV